MGWCGDEDDDDNDDDGDGKEDIDDDKEDNDQYIESDGMTIFITSIIQSCPMPSAGQRTENMLVRV